MFEPNSPCSTGCEVRRGAQKVLRAKPPGCPRARWHRSAGNAALLLPILAILGAVGSSCAGVRPAPPLAATSDYHSRSYFPNEVVDLSVAFKIDNAASSGNPCATDGSAPTVKGHLIGSRSVLHGGSASVVSLHLYGFDSAERNWPLGDTPDAGLLAEIARAGDVSLLIDPLGPESKEAARDPSSCVGSQGEIANQILAKLAKAEYSIDGVRPLTRFTPPTRPSDDDPPDPPADPRPSRGVSVLSVILRTPSRMGAGW